MANHPEKKPWMRVLVLAIAGVMLLGFILLPLFS
jgi:hypothetical protein